MAQQPYGTSFYGDLASRIGRLLGLSGEIAPGVDIDAKAVLLAGDGTGPGFAGAFRGRQFGHSGGLQVVGAFGPTAQYLATEDLVIETLSFWVDNTAAFANQIYLAYFGPSDAKPLGAGSAQGRITERGASNGEIPPITFASSGGINPGLPPASAFYSWRTNIAISQSVERTLPRPLFLCKGSALLIYCASTNFNNLKCSLMGRVF